MPHPFSFLVDTNPSQYSCETYSTMQSQQCVSQGKGGSRDFLVAISRPKLSSLIIQNAISLGFLAMAHSQQVCILAGSCIF